MRSLNTTARQAGGLYLVFMLLAILGAFAFPRFAVPGDAAATARNILAGEVLYRVALLDELGTLVLFILVVAKLYELFREVDRYQSMIMVLLVSVGVAVSFVNLLTRLVPLVLIGGDSYLSVFTGAQLDALALAALRFHAGGQFVAMVFWGLWLVPFGTLVLKSEFLPRVLGVLLLVAGAGYLITSLTSLALPQYGQTVARFAMPLYFGEVPIIFWLLIKGARDPQRRPA